MICFTFDLRTDYRDDFFEVIALMKFLIAMMLARKFENVFTRFLADILGISRAVAYQLMREDSFPTLRIGKRMVVPKDRFIAWLEATTSKP